MKPTRPFYEAFTIVAALNVVGTPILAQALRSPEVSSDSRVTVRFRAPNAKEVFLNLEGAPRLIMKKADNGVWTATTDPLEPDFYGYSIVADGVGYIDPANSLMKPNLLNTQSMVHVPGPKTLPWEVNDVPHGDLHRHFYKSGVVGDQRDYYVYTPPGYDRRAATTYPTLYLLHGYSDDAGGWSAVGRAHTILDNLIAQRKAKPMLVVMPLGYGAPEIVAPGGAGLSIPNAWQRNVEKFRETVTKELVPMVERDYKVIRSRESRAIAGLSMGGTEALSTGLNAVDQFAWIGAFSAGGLLDDNSIFFPKVDARVNEKLKLVWIATGDKDFVLSGNRKFTDWLKSKGVKHIYKETAGAHTWLVWRRYLAEFAPMLFR